jgi:antitoxin CcdA
MSALYNTRAPKRPVNLSLNEDLILKLRAVTGNLSERVEILLVAFLEAEHARRADADAALAGAVAAWNTFGERVGSFADEHSTL